MLGRNSIAGPQLNDPMVRVKVLTPFYIGGRLCEPGITMSMLSSDAMAAARNVTPPQVELV